MNLQVCQTRVEHVNVVTSVPIHQQFLHAFGAHAKVHLQVGAVALMHLSHQRGVQATCG